MRVRAALALSRPSQRTGEHLLDAEANGWVTHTAFVGTAGWSLTDRGRRENERQLAAELARTGRVDEIRNAYDVFLPQNGRVLQARTDWRLKPVPGPSNNTDSPGQAAHCRRPTCAGR